MQWGYEMMDGGNGWMWLWGGLMWLVIVATVGLVAWAVIRAVQPSAPVPHDRAREILAERFARGEISAEEYRERTQLLG